MVGTASGNSLIRYDATCKLDRTSEGELSSNSKWANGRMNIQGVLERLRQRRWREILFLVSVWVKGLDGLLELLGGAALLNLSPAFILGVVRLLTQDEIAEDPRDLVANALLRAASRLSLAGEHFMALYLLIHGVVKIALVSALLKRFLIAYPLSMVVFAGFVAYQLYRYTFTRGLGILALTALDFVVIALIYLEYRALRSGRV